MSIPDTLPDALTTGTTAGAPVRTYVRTDHGSPRPPWAPTTTPHGTYLPTIWYLPLGTTVARRQTKEKVGIANDFRFARESNRLGQPPPEPPTTPTDIKHSYFHQSPWRPPTGGT